MQPKYDTCSTPAICDECGEHLGFYINEDNAYNALSAHRKNTKHALPQKPKPPPKTAKRAKPKKAKKPKKPPKPKKRNYVVVRCVCGWEHDALDEMDAHASLAMHAGLNEACMEATKEATFEKVKK